MSRKPTLQQNTLVRPYPCWPDAALYDPSEENRGFVCGLTEHWDGSHEWTVQFARNPDHPSYATWLSAKTWPPFEKQNPILAVRRARFAELDEAARQSFINAEALIEKLCAEIRSRKSLPKAQPHPILAIPSPAFPAVEAGAAPIAPSRPVEAQKAATKAAPKPRARRAARRAPARADLVLPYADRFDDTRAPLSARRLRRAKSARQFTYAALSNLRRLIDRALQGFAL